MEETRWQDELYGCVDDITWREARGWIVGPAGKLPAKLDVYLDDMKVRSAWADTPNKANSLGEARAFRIPLRGIWDYCSVDTRVSVRLNGVPLPMAKKGIYKRPAKDGEYSLDDLRQKLEAGYVFSHTGWLQLSKKLDKEWQAAVIDLYTRVRDVVHSRHGYDVFVIYGSLLGQVREQGFIGHDNDFDAAFVCSAKDGSSAAAELVAVAYSLIDAGFDVETRMTALHIHHETDPSLRIDLFHVYFDEQGSLQMPFGHAGPTVVTRDDWNGTTVARMADHDVIIPTGAEKWVEHMYGEGWRIPDPSFHWDSARIAMASDAHIPASDREAAYWANFYAHHEFTTGSTFFEFVRSRQDLPGAVLDIGCGDGRDAFAFAQQGYSTWGIDRSLVGIEHAAKRSLADGIDHRLTFVVADVADESAVKTLISQARSSSRDGRVLFYLRFFLHSIPEALQETLLSIIASASVAGDMLAVEFRTDKDEHREKVYGKHYRRFQNADEFVTSLPTRYGFDVEYQVESAGLSPYKGEDPVLCRVIGRKVSPDPAPVAIRHRVRRLSGMRPVLRRGLRGRSDPTT